MPSKKYGTWVEGEGSAREGPTAVRVVASAALRRPTLIFSLYYTRFESRPQESRPIESPAQLSVGRTHILRACALSEYSSWL